jgi:hypothetical protein
MFYEDDHFHPNNVDDDIEGEEIGYYSDPRIRREPSVCSVSTVETYRKKQRKNMDEYKMIDKGYHKITLPCGVQKIEIEYYHTSSTPGTMIRDAITGARSQDHRVGTKEEDLYFKARIAIVNVDNDGTLVFFNSPEQYERHMHATISQEFKELWHNRCAVASKLYSEKTANRPGFVSIK